MIDSWYLNKSNSFCTDEQRAWKKGSRLYMLVTEISDKTNTYSLGQDCSSLCVALLKPTKKKKATVSGKKQ